MARRPSQPSDKPSIAKLIERLSFLSNVDTMLVEGVSPTDVAHYIQDEMGALKEVESKALANALRVRQKQKQENFKKFSALPDADVDPDDDCECDDDGAEEPEVMVDPRLRRARPSSLAKTIYARTKGGIKDLLELEALYLSQRDRVDRMVTLELRHGMFSKDVGREIVYAGELLMMRVKTKVDLGLDDENEVPHLDLRRYSEETVSVLSNPESRHRVISLLQRMAKLGKLKADNSVSTVEPEDEEQIQLPPPKKE